MVRVMIVLLLLGSAYLGWNYSQQKETLARYEAAIAPDGPIEEEIYSTQIAAHKFSQLQGLAGSQLKKIGDSSESSIFTQVQEVAQLPEVSMGGFSVSKPSRKSNREGFTDMIYRIEHLDTKEAVQRDRLANFFFKLERSHRSMKVTGVEVKLADRAKPTEIPADLWDVEFEVTIREEAEKRR